VVNVKIPLDSVFTLLIKDKVEYFIFTSFYGDRIVSYNHVHVHVY